MYGTDHIDAVVGQNIRRFRFLRRVSQKRLADAIGVTFQQVQKYERASNRISASKLYQVAQFFQVSVAAFYAGTDDPAAGEFDKVLNLDPVVSKLGKALMAIRSKRVRTSLIGLIDYLSDPKEGDEADDEFADQKDGND